jgi:prepilin-type N-terminal cleavage/methylation domain-containing protein
MPAHSRPRRAFTLIEILVVVAVMALLVGSVALSFTGPLHRARTVEAIEQVKYLDASSRQFAKRFGRGVELVFDLSEGTMERRGGGGGGSGGGGAGGDREATFTATVASPLQLAAVYTAGRKLEYGQAKIPVSPLGLCETYAVKLTGPDAQQKWVLVTGLGGEVITFNDDAQVEAILSHASPSSRRDAD